MWSYLLRRLLLMIPTLFGVTVISFVIMQCAPGDPLLSQLGSSGNASQAGQTPEAFREMKRDLKLDKPLVLNFNDFRDYSQPVRIAAHYRAQTSEQIAAELPQLAAAGNDPLLKSRLNFLRDLGIPDFDERMKKPETYPHLVRAIDGYVQRWCEDAGEYAVPAAMEILDDKQSDLRLQIGAIRALASMTVDPFPSTLPQDPTPADLERVESIWKLWWNRNQNSFEKLDADARQAVQTAIANMSHLKSRREMLDGLDYLERDQAPAFVEILLGKSSAAEKEIAIMALRKTVGAPLEGDVALDALPEQVAQVAENWRTYYAGHAAQYQPSFGRRLWSIVADTQYGHMLVRLATFQFGHSAMKLREPVSQLIWEALLVSVPLMFMAEACHLFDRRAAGNLVRRRSRRLVGSDDFLRAVHFVFHSAVCRRHDFAVVVLLRRLFEMVSDGGLALRRRRSTVVRAVHRRLSVACRRCPWRACRCLAWQAWRCSAARRCSMSSTKITSAPRGPRACRRPA